MDYLIDGNNLLFAAHSHGPGAPIGREWLCEVLARWAGRTKVRVEVVFDGPPPGAGLQAQMRAGGLEVGFSAPRSADEVIEERIARADRPTELCVVTGDHAIQWAARARRCACLESTAFAEMLFAPVQAEAEPPPAVPPEKPARPSKAESDAWLRRFDYDPDEPPDETDLMRY